jgi:isochorismate synthase
VNDFLAYRFPGREIEKKIGIFKEIAADDISKGFVVSNIDFSKTYIFIENSQNLKEFHFSQEEPYTMNAREYYLQAHELLNGLNHFQMKKAVFSRVKSQLFDKNLIEDLFFELEKNYKNAFVYLASSQIFGTWIGASPEVLLEAHSDFMFTTSLAGTKKPEEIEFEWGEKEIFEQQIVTDYIKKTLETIKLKSIETNGPYDFSAGPVTHLKTDISADMNGVSPWLIARNLHPTPAISGYPKEKALGLIRSVEPHDRGIYTGVIGEIDEKSSKLYVNLRCGQLINNTLFLYLGGGFTMQSIPELEWVETENKSKTILNFVKKLMEVKHK